MFNVKGTATLLIPEDFVRVTSDMRAEVSEWLETIKDEGPEHAFGMEPREIWERKDFIRRARIAVKYIDYEYYCAGMEPSFDEDGKIYYKKGMPVGKGIGLEEWKTKAAEFFNSSGWHSELAILMEGDLFKAWRVAKGFWTLDYICNDSSSEGNFKDSPDSSHGFEVSGSRKVGGFRDGVGNTHEVYQTDDRKGFVVVGGSAKESGDIFPAASARYFGEHYIHQPIIANGRGIVVIKRNS